MSRRPATAGHGAVAARAVSAESAVPLPPLPIARAAGSRPLTRAVAFAVFMALFAALWEVVPVLASWMLSRQLQLPLLHDQTVRHLLLGGALRDSKFAFNVRTALAMLLLGTAGFVCSYRASASARPVAALDNGAC
jgi:hypothetical protein